METKDMLLTAEQIVEFLDFLERGEQVIVSLSNTKTDMYRVTAPRDMVDNFKMEEHLF